MQNRKFITDFKEKADFFDDFFTKQCSFVNNNSSFLLVLTKKPEKLLSTGECLTNDILKIIKNLNPNKSHGLCDESICKSLGKVFRSCLENDKLPSEW